MADNNFLNELAVDNKLNELFVKYQIESKKGEIIKQVVLGFIKGVILEHDLASEIEEKVNLDLGKAIDLAYDLIEEIVPLLPPEIKEQLKKEDSLPESDASINLQQILEEAKKEANLKIEKQYEKRFDEAVFNWFRDIRDDTETIEALTKSNKVGGLALSYKQAQDLVSILKKKEIEVAELGIDILSLIAKELEKTEPFLKKEETAEEEIDVSAKATKVAEPLAKPTGQEVTIDKLLEEKNIPYQELAAKEAIKRQLGERERVPEVQGELAKEITAKEEFLESKEELEPPDVPVPSPAPKAPASPVQPKPQMPAPAETKFEVKQPLIRKTMSEVRPRVEDVKFTAQLVGPIDELAVLKIEDFRRLAKEPEVAAKKIMAKLGLLEEESLTKKAEGIKALKSSPLYKVYSDIMNQAIKEGKSIEQVTEENPIITMAEFKAIMELNKSLKY